MDYQQFIKPELLILIPVLYFIGMAIKKSALKDKFIPLILGAISIFLSGIYVIANCELNGTQAIATALFTAITQGVLVAGASVYVNQIIKQSQKEE
jgi:hypothetical protein